MRAIPENHSPRRYAAPAGRVGPRISPRPAPARASAFSSSWSSYERGSRSSGLFSIHDYKVRAFQPRQTFQPFQPAIWRDGQAPIAAVIRHEHAVLLQPFQNRLGVLRKALDVEILPKPQSFAHTRQIFIRQFAGEMSRRINVSAPRPPRRD